MAARSKRALSDDEAGRLTNEQFSSYMSGEWHPDDDAKTESPEEEKKEKKFKSMRELIQDRTRTASSIK